MRTKTRIPKAERMNGKPLFRSGWSRCDLYAIILGTGMTISLTLSILAYCRDTSETTVAVRDLTNTLRSFQNAH